MKNIILIGLPGSGKGTQSKKISKDLGYEHISTGDLIREEQEKESYIGKMATNLSDRGEFLPDDVVTSLVKQKIINSDNKIGFIFDGFPRTVSQAKSLEEFLFNRRSPIDLILNIVVQDSTVGQRIKERSLKENRVDDTPETLAVRINNYKLKTLPILDYFKNRKSVIDINGEQLEENVFMEIKNKIIS